VFDLFFYYVLKEIKNLGSLEHFWIKVGFPLVYVEPSGG